MTNTTCDKESFASYNDGREKLIHMNGRKGRHRYRLYKCDKCGMFHITTITKNLTTPKKIDKYPIKIEKVKKEKIHNPGKPKEPTSSKCNIQTTGKMMTKEQRDMLMRIVEANK